MAATGLETSRLVSSSFASSGLVSYYLATQVQAMSGFVASGLAAYGLEKSCVLGVVLVQQLPGRP